MRSTPLAIGLGLALTVAPLSASAHGFHHHGHGLFGLFGLAVVGAATLVTAPVRIIADAASGPGPGYDPREGYDQRYGGTYGPPPGYAAEDADGPRAYSGGPYGYPPRGYYAPPPRGYGPYYRPGYGDGPPPQASDPRARGESSNEYARDDDYNAPPSGYRDRRAYDDENNGQRGDDYNENNGPRGDDYNDNGGQRAGYDDERQGPPADGPPQRTYRDQSDDDGNE